MAKVVPDFRDASGGWAGYFSVSGQKYVTRLRKTYEHMLERCVSDGTFQQKYPSYRGCSTSFCSFQHFAAWAVDQIGYALPDSQLDKDLLIRGNLLYSESTCVFIPQRLNKLLLRRPSGRSTDLPVGVCWDKNRNLYKAQMGNSSQKFFGRFSTPSEAFLAYKKAKEDCIVEQANIYRAVIDPRAYAALLRYEVQITD